MILGWEMVTTRKDWKGFFASNLQLCQWTFASSPGNMLWRSVMDEILAFYAQKRHLEIKSVIRSTGPGMFSQAVKAYLKTQFGASLGEAPLTLERLMRKHLHVGDVLILKQSAFASGSGGLPGKHGLVRHQFKGSWKTSPPRVEEPSAVEQRDVAELRRELEKLKKENDRLRAAKRASGNVAAVAVNQASQSVLKSTHHWLQRAQKRLVDSEANIEKVASLTDVLESRDRDLVPQNEEEENAQRRKYLMQRLALKAAAHVDSKELDHIDELEKEYFGGKTTAPVIAPALMGGAALSTTRPHQLLAPHNNDQAKTNRKKKKKKKQPFNHGMD